jgi:hypothetical protein
LQKAAQLARSVPGVLSKGACREAPSNEATRAHEGEGVATFVVVEEDSASEELGELVELVVTSLETTEELGESVELGTVSLETIDELGESVELGTMSLETIDEIEEASTLETLVLVTTSVEAVLRLCEDDGVTTEEEAGVLEALELDEMRDDEAALQVPNSLWQPLPQYASVLPQ